MQTTFTYPLGKDKGQQRPTPFARFYPQNQSWWPQGQPLDSAEKRTAPLFRKPTFTDSGAQPMPTNTLFPRPTRHQQPVDLDITRRWPNRLTMRSNLGRMLGSQFYDQHGTSPQYAPPEVQATWASGPTPIDFPSSGTSSVFGPYRTTESFKYRVPAYGNPQAANYYSDPEYPAHFRQPGNAPGLPQPPQVATSIPPSGYSRPLAPQAQADMLGQDYYDGPATPPMQSPQRQVASQAGFIPGGPIPFQRPDPYDTPYYNARRARNAMGQGSPYIPGGQYMTAQQRQAGYAAMPQMPPGPQAPAAQSPLQRMAMTQQPSMNPMTAQGPSPLARMGIDNPNRQFGGAGRSPFPTGSDAELRSVLPVNREDRLARVNQLGQGGQTLEQAAGDPNFNADGRFFQGAQLGMDQDGRAYFRERENRTFAGGVSNDSIAAGNRLRTLQEMEARGRGYVLPSGGFAGIGDGTAAVKTSPEQLAENRTNYLARMQQGRQQRMGRVQENAQLAAARRRESMNPSPLNRLMAQNPQMAAAMQMQNAQMQHAMNLQALENQGRVGVADAQGRAQAAEMERRGMFALAANGNQAALNRLGFADPGAAAPGGVGQTFKPGAFDGVDEATHTVLSEYAKTNTLGDLYRKMAEMKIPANLRPALANKLKPPGFWNHAQSWWNKLGAAAAPIDETNPDPWVNGF